MTLFWFNLLWWNYYRKLITLLFYFLLCYFLLKGIVYPYSQKLQSQGKLNGSWLTPHIQTRPGVALPLYEALRYLVYGTWNISTLTRTSTTVMPFKASIRIRPLFHSRCLRLVIAFTAGLRYHLISAMEVFLAYITDFANFDFWHLVSCDRSTIKSD